MSLRHVSAVQAVALATVAALMTPACGGGPFTREYEYEEELYLSLDGSATLNVNASVAALVALRGASLDVDPLARIDRDDVIQFFAGAGDPVRVTLSRRDGRRFVHARIDVDDVRTLSQQPPFAWSTYEFDPQDGGFEFHQVVGRPTGTAIPDVGWSGEEMVAFRLHLPSEVLFNNSPRPIQRGNILEWEQPLRERLEGQAVDMQVTLEADSILYTTLLLFGSTIMAAAGAFAFILWWVIRRGRRAQLAGSN